MIKRQEEIDEEKRKEFIERLNYLGGNHIFEKPIRFRLTPHSPTIYIHGTSIHDNFDAYGEARDAILQKLRKITP